MRKCDVIGTKSPSLKKKAKEKGNICEEEAMVKDANGGWMVAKGIESKKKTHVHGKKEKNSDQMEVVDKDLGGEVIIS